VRGVLRLRAQCVAQPNLRCLPDSVRQLTPGTSLHGCTDGGGRDTVALTTGRSFGMTVTAGGSLSPAADRSSSLDHENLDAFWRAANYLAVGQGAPDIDNWSWSS
jgi:hypothetical protein